MKRKITSVFGLVFLTMMLTTSIAFAGNFQLEKSAPKEGATGMPVENACVKLYFDKDVQNKENYKANKKCFTLTEISNKKSKGKKVPLKILYSHKEEGMILVLVDGQVLKENTKYQLDLSEDFLAADGTPLGENITIHYKTVDRKASMIGSMVLMGVMMVGIIFYSAHSMKKEAQKDAEEKILETKINPYKVAKETGKSVEEVIEKDRKEKEKQRKKLEKKKAKEAQKQEDEDFDYLFKEENFNKRVKAPRKASEAGSKYVEQLKVKREAEEKERLEQRRKAGTTNPKKKGKKKK